MRRLFNPEHVAHGDATGLYERTGSAVVVERRIWPRHLDGEMTRDEAMRVIIAELDPQPDPRRD
jgi:hypothetical protein